jgi:hypothetical protein
MILLFDQTAKEVGRVTDMVAARLVQAGIAQRTVRAAAVLPRAGRRQS